MPNTHAKILQLTAFNNPLLIFELFIRLSSKAGFVILKNI